MKGHLWLGIAILLAACGKQTTDSSNGTATFQSRAAGGGTTACGTLKAGQAFVVDQNIRSCNGLYSIIFQSDGNLVVYKANVGALWASGTYGNLGAKAYLQSDGNLVIYRADGAALFQTKTNGNASDELVMQDDGNAVIYSSDNRALWNSATYGRTRACSNLLGGTALHAGESQWSCNGRYQLIEQTDGNLVLYQVGGGALWSAGTYGYPGAVAIIQTDGNLVVYRADGVPLFQSATAGSYGAQLHVQDDGNLVIYNTASQAVWTRSSTLAAKQGTKSGCGLINGNDTLPALRPFESFTSCGGGYTLVMQGDGNLVLHQGNAAGRVTWNSGTYGHDNSSLYFLTSGRLVIRGPFGKPIDVLTDAGAGARFQVQPDGNLVVYNGLSAIWHIF